MEPAKKDALSSQIVRAGSALWLTSQIIRLGSFGFQSFNTIKGITGNQMDF
jgi:hypothetical protein